MPFTILQSLAYYLDGEDDKLFEVKEAVLVLPEQARIFRSYPCDCCGEITAEHWLRLSGDQKLCLDCYESYNRFEV